MKINASFFGPIKRPWPEQSKEIDVPEETDAYTLLESFGYLEEEMKRLAVVVNGQRKTLSAKLADGDQVRIVLFAGGG